MQMLEELKIPEEVMSAQRRTELVRIWLADNEQIVTLSANLWKDPGAWGLMLVDLAKHVVSAYAAQGYDEASTLNQIRAAMEAEWSSPTDHL